MSRSIRQRVASAMTAACRKFQELAMAAQRDTRRRVAGSAGNRFVMIRAASVGHHQYAGRVNWNWPRARYQSTAAASPVRAEHGECGQDRLLEGLGQGRSPVTRRSDAASSSTEISAPATARLCGASRPGFRTSARHRKASSTWRGSGSARRFHSGSASSRLSMTRAANLSEIIPVISSSTSCQEGSAQRRLTMPISSSSSRSR